MDRGRRPTTLTPTLTMVAFVALTVVVAACRAGPAASPSAAVASPTGQPVATPEATEAASPRPSEPAAASGTPPVGADSGARQLLMAVVGDAAMEIHEVGPGQSFGDLWDEAFAKRIADQIEIDPSALTVALARPVAGQEQQFPDGWMVLAVDFPRSNPKGVLGAYLAERLTRPDTEASLTHDLDDDARPVMGSDFSVAWTETALIIIGYDKVAYFTDPRADTAHAEGVVDAVSKAFSALPDRPTAPVPNPGPADEEEAPSAPPDPSMEAVLPTSVAGRPLTVSSAAFVPDDPGDNPGSGLFGDLLPHFDQPGSDAAVAFASAEGVTAFTIAHRLAGRTGDQLLAAALGELWANPSGFQLYRSADVDGRHIVYHQDWGFHAQEDVLYFFLYYGGYECAEDRTGCTFGPDDETERWMSDFVRAIPDPGSGGP